jgi:hypothetical protein
MPQHCISQHRLILGLPFLGAFFLLCHAADPSTTKYNARATKAFWLLTYSKPWRFLYCLNTVFSSLSRMLLQIPSLIPALASLTPVNHVVLVAHFALATISVFSPRSVVWVWIRLVLMLLAAKILETYVGLT